MFEIFTDLLLDHLKEIRSLRQRLEKSIETNDLLRLKLEEKLKGGETSPVTRNKLAKFEHEIESLKNQLETKDRQLKGKFKNNLKHLIRGSFSSLNTL